MSLTCHSPDINFPAIVADFNDNGAWLMTYAF